MAKSDSTVDDTNKNVEDDPKEVSGVAPTLDQVHQINQAKVEEEDAKNEDNADDSKDKADDTAGDDDSNVDDTSDTDDSTDGDDEATDTPPETPSVDKPETPAPTEPAAQLDSDTSKPGEGKIAIKDAEGKTSYFNSRDEMPEDFEPASYKALMDAAAQFAKKETADEQAAAEAKVKAEADAEVAEAKKRTDALQVEWDKDATDLTSIGFLPKDPKKNEAAKNEVYDYIEKELKDGNIITSFKQAYKSMMYDKEQAKSEEAQKKIDQTKKDRGAMVQGGNGPGTASSGSTRGKVIEAPPQGVGLDAVHARAIEQLGA